MKKLFTAAFALALTATAASAQATSWTIDSKHSSAQFAVRHMMISNVRGSFSNVSGTVNYDGKDPTKATVEATIDTSSVNTQEASRDKHLIGADFFDTAKFPTMTFKSKKIVSAGDGKYNMTGDLTLHGVTKEVTMVLNDLSPAVNDGHGNTKVGANATGKINRKDFGISYGGALDNGGAMISDEVAITLDIELAKKAAVSKAN
jgi:polyisoprenoid-binding protein YceI